MDRCDEFEAKGIFARKYQQLLDAVVIGGTLGMALWEGTESPQGRTAWQSLDSMATAAVATELMKNVFQRPRPSQSSNPDLWRQGSGNKSFPSGETATMAAFVTPIIIDYQEEHPAVWALSVPPAYMGKARMGSQAHWLSDVLRGAAVGVAAGTLAARSDRPLLLELAQAACSSASNIDSDLSAPAAVARKAVVFSSESSADPGCLPRAPPSHLPLRDNAPQLAMIG